MIVKPKIYQGSGTYKVRFFYWDVVGGVLTDKVIERYVNAGGTVIAPAIPTTLSATTKRSPALEFDSWNITTLTNIQQDVDVGAIYKNATESGVRKTYAYIVVTATTGYTVPVYFSKSDDSTLTISWGDGSADYTTTSSGNVNTSHVYSTDGTYEIKMWISTGTGTYTFGNGSNTTTFIGGNTGSYRTCLLNLFFGDNVTAIGDYAFYQNYISKTNITNNITSLGAYCFSGNYSLNVINISNSVTSIGNYSFSDCYKLLNINLSNSVTSIGNYSFGSCRDLQQVIIPNNITSLGEDVFYRCMGLKKVILSTGLTTISAGMFESCYGLTDINIPSNITSIGDGAFYESGYPSNIDIPSSVTSIGAQAFNVASKLTKIIINRFTAPSTITTLGASALASLNNRCRIYVPTGSGDIYKGATNWSTYASQIYENTAENRALFGD